MVVEALETSLRAEKRQEHRLLFLGTCVAIAAPPALLDRYTAVFGGLPAAARTRAAELSFEIDRHLDAFRVRVTQDGDHTAHAFPTEDNAFSFVYAGILDQVTRRDPGLLCTHAAALARSGRGIAIAAPSCNGKSTLTLALAARGWDFLSDEVAAIHLESLRMLPFPIAVGCRSGTSDLLRGTTFERHGFEARVHAAKTYLRPAAAAAAHDATLDTVFFLELEEGDRSAGRRYRMLIEPHGRDVAARLARIPGVQDARLEPGDRVMAIELEPGAWVAPAVEKLLREEGRLVADVVELDLPAPDFTAEPRLTRLGTAAGVLRLLHHLRGFGALEDLALAAPDGFGGLVTALARRMRGVRFWRLTPGRLSGLVEAIESAVL